MGKKLKYLDKTLLIVSIILFVIGLVMIFSASNVTAYMTHAKSPYSYFIRQSAFLIAGIILFFIIIVFNTKTSGKLSRLLMFIVIGALVAVLVYGAIRNQARSWFQLKQFTIQPSEFAKVITIAYLAEYYEENKNRLNGWIRSLLPIILCIGIAILIFIQPDLGTMIIYTFIVAGIFFAQPMSKEIKYKIGFMTLALFIIGIAIIMGPGKNILEDRQKERFNFMNPCERILGDGNQVCNCYIAINNGGLTGVGLGNSTQKYLYLPEPYTDFIYAIIVEELGVVVGIIILLMYALVIFRILMIGKKSPTNRGATICYGVALYIILHIAVNLLGIMGLMPMTGVPLPFMSYGGSYTLCLVAALTLVQRVSIENGILKEKSGKNA